MDDSHEPTILLRALTSSFRVQCRSIGIFKSNAVIQAARCLDARLRPESSCVCVSYGGFQWYMHVTKHVLAQGHAKFESPQPLPLCERVECAREEANALWLLRIEAQPQDAAEPFNYGPRYPNQAAACMHACMGKCTTETFACRSRTGGFCLSSRVAVVVQE